jgi:hypothetical protein
MQGANRSHSVGYGEDLQRRRPPKSTDASAAMGLFQRCLNPNPGAVAPFTVRRACAHLLLKQ